MCGSMVDIQSATADIRRGKKEEEQRKKQDKTTSSTSYMRTTSLSISLYSMTGE